jgi:ribosomal protein S18 acetylase RimI-like enzyme
MIIRSVTLIDIPHLVNLAQKTYSDTFGHTMSKEELQHALDERSEEYFLSIMNQDVVLVAENSRQLVGFVQFGNVTYNTASPTDSDIELNKIYVEKSYQGKGIGKKLIEAMLSHDRLAGVENIYLDVFAKNEKAIGLYKKYGFQIIGKTPFKIKGQILGYDLLMKRENNVQTKPE